MKPFLLLHRGLQDLGKLIAGLTVLVLMAVLVGGPVVAILTFAMVAAATIAPLVGGGPGATAILLMAFLFAFSFFGGVYVAPHVQIGKAVGALVDGMR
jgi:hypothetical protein